MTAPVHLRPAVPAEAGQLTELAVRSKGHWGHDAAFLERARGDLTITEEDVATCRVRVAERDGQAIGFSAIRYAGEESELEMLFVAPEAIGTGVGRLLLRDALDAARDAGASLADGLAS